VSFAATTLCIKSRDSSVGIALGYGLDDRGSRFDSKRGLGIFLFTTASRMALGPTQPPIQWVSGALSLGVKRPEREADHSLPSSAKVKNAWSYTSIPRYVFMVWCLVKHRDNFTYTLPFNPLCCFSTSVCCCKRIFRYRLNPENRIYGCLT
jgi:hypothetical protein